MYPTGRYGTGIRGLGSVDDLALMSAQDLIPIDASYTSFQPYLNWASGGNVGVASTAPAPASTTNQSGTAPTGTHVVGFNQWAGSNQGTLALVALGLLALVLLKK